jgi:pyruvate dehydrogenase E2 component (dihydrolipoamide acetyltransferase)
MPIKVLMPALSPTMEHANLVKWVKKEGDMVVAGEVIAEIETDKVTMEVESVDDGLLAKIIIPEGTQEVPVNSLLAILLEEGENQDVLNQCFVNKQDANVNDDVVSSLKTEPKDKGQIVSNVDISGYNNILESKTEGYVQEEEGVESNSNKTERNMASPLAKRLALISNINLNNVIGTGPRGRVVKDDVLTIIKSMNASVSRNPEPYRLLENSNMRRITAKRLSQSKLTIPHFYLSVECIMDAVVQARLDVNKSLNQNESPISLNDFIIMASSKALKDVPEVNATWSCEGIKLYNNVDIAVAVAITGGLITPIIRNADQKSLITISREMNKLIDKARSSSLRPEEFEGASFSISNLGMYGIKSFSAIINPPQVAILSVGSSNKRAFVVENNIGINTIMDISLSCDHRAIDGAVAAMFLEALKKYIESPTLMFI